ncbi:MAG: LamG domain-containing protein, partial [Bdellovibrionota bacterium]
NSGGHGQYAGGITFGVQHPPDADTGDSAITLDGSSGVIGLTPVVTDITNGFTSEIWFKTTSAATAGGLPDVSNPLLEDSQAGTTGLSGVDGGQVSFCRYDGVTWQCITSVHFFNDGAWHLSTCTHDSISGAMNLYVDGQLEATGNATYGVAGGSIDRIGQDYNGGPGNFFSGSIDEVAVYPSVLSLARIQAHYAARGTFCP